VSLTGVFLRRNFEPVVLSVQVLVDLGVLLLACWLGYTIGENAGRASDPSPAALYQKLSALVAAVCLVTFHAFGLYKPTKSLLNMQEFQAIFKGDGGRVPGAVHADRLPAQHAAGGDGPRLRRGWCRCTG
jgi:hypothetical protein